VEEVVELEVVPPPPLSTPVEEEEEAVEEVAHSMKIKNLKQFCGI
jgi:hypothetical protein